MPLASVGEEWPADVPTLRAPMAFPLHQSRTRRFCWPPGAESFKKVENLETSDGFIRLGSSREGAFL